MMVLRTAFFVVCILLSPLAANSAAADAVADFYKGKRINVVVGYGVGGGYDVYTRLLARHMPRFIPGNPTMIVQNMPGAGSVRAANFLANSAPRDGSTLGVFGAPAALEPLFGNKGAQFDALKFNWIGNMMRDVTSCVSWHNHGINSLDDVIKSKTPIAFGATGIGSAGHQHALVLKNMLGANLKVIAGFPSVKDVGLGLERDEVQVACAMFVSTAKAAFASQIRDKQFKFLIQFGEEDVPYFQGAPNFYRMIKTDEQRQVARLFFGQVEIARPLIGPPDMPQPIVAALRKAMAETLKDEAMLADAAKFALDIVPMSGEQTAEMFDRFYRSSPAVVAKAKEIMERD